MNLVCNLQHRVNVRERWTSFLVQMLDDYRVHVTYDRSGDLWESAKLVLTSYPKEASHVMVIQDDCLPCKDLIQTVEKLIEFLPDNLITLFSNRDEVLQARAEGKSWALLNRLLMAQSYIIPKSMIEDFIPFAEKHIKPEIYYDDNRLTLWALKNNIKIWTTAPSLVNHQGAFETTIRGGYKKGHNFFDKSRLASWYIGFEESGLNIDWTKGLDKPITDRSEGDWAGVCQYYIE